MKVDFKEFILFAEFVNLILYGYLLFIIILIPYAFYTLIYGPLIFSLLLFVGLLLLFTSFYTTVKLTSLKSINIVDRRLILKYEKFGKVFYSKNIPIIEIIECEIKPKGKNKSEEDLNAVILKTRSTAIRIGQNINKSKAQKIKEIIENVIV